MFDYETLRLIWWILLGVLLAGFATTDGFDLGVGFLLPFVARKDVERRIAINTIGPVWEGNQVWIILGAGAIFAAWPIIYAVSFSGFYLAMLLVLAAFILRPVGFKYRSKLTHPSWRKIWDGALFLGGFIPALIFGLALGNVLQGVPFHFDDTLRSFYTGSFWGLLNPFALLCGLTSIALLGMHGSYYLTVKTNREVQRRAITASRFFSISLIVLFTLAGLWVGFKLQGYVLTGNIIYDGPSNPMHDTVMKMTGAWVSNYRYYPISMLVPGLVYFGATMALLSSLLRKDKLAFFFSGLSVFMVVATVGVSMFPFILPSSSMPNQSLTVWNASSSQTTLSIMLFATVVFMPIILVYTAWVYRVLRGKITQETIESDSHTMY
ncbi:MAG: cytochrome d ubiquinol oxidase subunit II [Legionellales bacterium]|nr:cytochrome d ubiquinol oxidase subunit II [Legionellales bacterium]|tara:strand:- start:226 stop:1365 length:1140 start_codon:yes stop_codon:yes gene_type:complete